MQSFARVGSRGEHALGLSCSQLQGEGALGSTQACDHCLIHCFPCFKACVKIVLFPFLSFPGFLQLVTTRQPWLLRILMPLLSPSGTKTYIGSLVLVFIHVAHRPLRADWASSPLSSAVPGAMAAPTKEQLRAQLEEARAALEGAKAECRRLEVEARMAEMEDI